MELPSTVLDGAPDLAGGRGGTLSSDERVDASTEGGERVLDMGALAVTRTEEDGVEADKDPRSALEENGRQKDTEPEEDLEAGDDGHGSIIVLLDKGTDLISERAVYRGSVVGRGTIGSGSVRSALGGGESGDQVGASVGSNVEDREDGVGEKSQRVLGSEEPDEGHD